jgi:hypothetical protein
MVKVSYIHLRGYRVARTFVFADSANWTVHVPALTMSLRGASRLEESW